MVEVRWEVPPSWAWASMGDVAEIIGGGTPSTSDDGNFAEAGIPWLTPADLTGYQEVYISRGRRDLSERGYRSSAARIMPSGTVLFSSRAPVGYCAIASGDISTNQGFKSFVLKGDLIPEYIRHYLLGSVDYAESKASGTTFKELSGSRAAELAVPLPPLPEQRRIVAKIDSLTGKSRRARDHLDHIPRLVEKYKQAVLAAAFRGDLTRQWRASHTLPDADWETIELGQIADVGTGATPKRGTSRYYEGGTVPWVTSGAVNDEIVRGSEECITAAALRETNCQLYPVGTLLLAMYGEGKTRGKVAVLGMEAATNQALAAIVVHRNGPAERDFVLWYLRSQYLELREQAAGGVQPNLNLGIIKRTLLSLPPQIEQREIVQRLEAAFAWIDRLGAEATSARRLIDRLDQAVLAKAFRGELVPQDPEDEPASMLLDRIKAERGALSKAKRGRKVPVSA